MGLRQRRTTYQELGLRRTVVFETRHVSVAICGVKGSGARSGWHQCAGKVVPAERGGAGQVLAEVNAMGNGFGDHPHLVAPVAVKIDEDGSAKLAYPHAGKDLTYLQRGLGTPRRKGLKAKVYKVVVETTFDVLQAMQHIHNEGFVHGDVKTLNLLRKGGFTRAADFGLCSHANSPIKGHSICNPVADLFVRLPSGRRVYDCHKACAEANTWHIDVHAVGYVVLELLGVEPAWLNVDLVGTACFKPGYFEEASPEEAWSEIEEATKDNAAMMLSANNWPLYLSAKVEHKGLRDLLGHMLCPREARWTAQQLLAHPVFEEVARDYPARLAKVQPRWEEDRRSAAIAAESFLSAECRVRGQQLQQQLDAADSHQQHHEGEGEGESEEEEDEECEADDKADHEGQPAFAAQQVAAAATAEPATPAAVIKQLMNEHAALQKKLTAVKRMQQQLQKSADDALLEAACLQRAEQELLQKEQEIQQQWKDLMQRSRTASGRTCRPQQQATSLSPTTDLQHQQHAASSAPAPATGSNTHSCASSSAGISSDIQLDADLVATRNLTAGSQQAMKQAEFLAPKIQQNRNTIAAAEQAVQQAKLDLAAQQQANLHSWDKLMGLRQKTHIRLMDLFDLQQALASNQQQEKQQKQSGLAAQQEEHEQQLAALQAQLAEAQQQLDTVSAGAAAAASSLATSQQEMAKKDAQLLATQQQLHQQHHAMSQLVQQLVASGEQLKLESQHKFQLQLQLTAAHEAAEHSKADGVCVHHSSSDDGGIMSRGASETLQLLSPGLRDSSSSDSSRDDGTTSSTGSSSSSSTLTSDDGCDAVVRVVLRVSAGSSSSSNTNKAAPMSQSAKAFPCSRELPQSCFSGDDGVDGCACEHQLVAEMASAPTRPKVWRGLRGCVVGFVRKLVHC